MTDHVAAFIDFLHSHAIPPANSREIIPDDRIRRFVVAGDRINKKNVSYKLAINGDVSFGWARSHVNDQTYTFFSGRREEMTKEQRDQLAAQMEANKKQRAQDLINRQSEVAAQAQKLFAESDNADRLHPYLLKKGINGGRMRQRGKKLLIPLYDADHVLWNLQEIHADGTKMFLPGGRITGLYFPLGKAPVMRDLPYIFCEGVATGKTIEAATDYNPVCCTMNAGNMVPVAREVRKKIKFARFLFAADMDAWTMIAKFKQEQFKDLDLKALPGDDPRWDQWDKKGYLWNPGTEKAITAAAKTGGTVVRLPGSYVNHRDKPTDFNDLAALAGIDTVRKIFERHINDTV